MLLNCPWCKQKAVVRNSPIGFFVECSKNGHIHNLGVFGFDKSFHKTEDEAIKEWNNQIKNMKLKKGA